MAKATDKQIRYIEALTAKLPENQRFDRGKVIGYLNDHFEGVANASHIIDLLKAKVAALPQQQPTRIAYTPAEDAATQPSVNERRYTGTSASWYYSRNGAGRDELDNQ